MKTKSFTNFSISRYSSMLIAILLVCFLNSRLKAEDCSCDLTPNVCDILCCCDTNDCSVSDFEAFHCSQELEQPKNVFYGYCIPSSLIYKSNTPYIVNVIKDLFCVQADIQTKFETDKISISEKELENIVNRINPNFDISSNQDVFDQTRCEDIGNQLCFFTVNDRIWYISAESLTPGFLTIPTKSATKLIASYFPVNYLTNKKSKFTYKKCANDWIKLNLKLLEFGEVKFIAKPNGLKNCTNNLLDCKDLISLRISCTLPDGAITEACSVTNTINQNSAFNIKSFIYIFEYLNPVGILRATLNVIFEECDDARPGKHEQSVEILFLKTEEKDMFDSFDSLEAVMLSGNPGYQVGKNLIADFWNGSKFSEEPTRKERFTTFLTCAPESRDRTPIKFRQNSAAECDFKSLKTTDFDCSDYQDKIFKIFTGGSDSAPNYVAKFGNLIGSKNISEWIKIENAEPTNIATPASDQTTSLNTCKNLFTSLSVEIAYANVGNVASPQATLVKVVYNWGAKSEVSCAVNTDNECEFKVRIVSRVTFVDASLDPWKNEQRLPLSIQRLPGNFLKPIL